MLYLQSKALGQGPNMANSYKWFLTCFHASFFLFDPFAGHPSSSPSLATFLPFSPPRKVLYSVEQIAQHRAWNGAGPGWTFPQSSGRKFLPEIRAKKVRFGEGGKGHLKGVFAEKGARFRGKWGSAPSAPPPPPQNSPYTPLAPPPSPLLEEPPPPGIFSKTPNAPQEKGGGGGEAGGGGGAPRPHLPRKRAPFSAKTPFEPRERKAPCIGAN